MRKNKLKQMFKEGKPIINGWLQIPNAFSAEVMAHQGWDYLHYRYATWCNRLS